MITDYLKSEDKFELAVKTIDDESREYIDSAIKRFDDLLEQDSEDFRRGVVASSKLLDMAEEVGFEKASPFLNSIILFTLSS